MKPDISVIVPAYNGARFYEAALNSILLQQWPSLEIIVVDDGSTDNLAAEIERLAVGVIYLQQSQKGPSAARNLGIKNASSSLIAFLDVDDIWTAGHLDRMHAALALHPEAGIVQGLMQQMAVFPDGRSVLSGTYQMPHLGTCLFRREVLKQLGGFDEGMQMGEDYDLIFRCWENDVIKFSVDEVSLLYRRHPGNMTHGKNREAYLAVVQRRMQRIRTGVVDPAAPHSSPFGMYSGNIDNFWKDQVETAGACSH
jgi:glycosyltransferase involved in cell wall biosynthesis